MKKQSALGTFISSVQLKFAATFLILIAALLAMLNIYPTLITRDLVFASKQTALQSQAAVMTSALAGGADLSASSVNETMNLLDTHSLTRVLVTDSRATVLYDTSAYDPAIGRYALLSEIARALEGKMVFHSIFDGSAFMTTQVMPIRSGGITIGAVFLYEYDAAQAKLIQSIQSNIRNLTLALGLSAIILMFIFSRALTSRITDLARATRIVSEGNYDHQIEVRGRDELSQLGTEFNALTQRLKETEELRRRFVSDASHELKTPLAAIRLLSDSIVNAENMDDSTMREFVADIGNEAERLHRTTEKLLSLTRIDGHVETLNTRLELKPIAEKTIHLLAPLAEENQVGISTDLHDACIIKGNEDLIYRVVFNLAENGIKYTLPGGTVKIRLFSGEGNVNLIVEDTGIGIPQEDMPHIFSRFYRVDKARSRDAGGSGLGLSIVRDAVVIHGGTITVEHRHERGTRFIVRFPACPQEEEKQ